MKERRKHISLADAREICQEHAFQKTLSLRLDFSQNPRVQLHGKPMLNEGHRVVNAYTRSLRKMLRTAFQDAFTLSMLSSLGFPAFNQV